MNIPTNLKYSKTDEWFDPATGKQVAAVESVKAAADSYSPVTGKVAEVNEGLSDNPEVLNKDPYGEGWMAQVEGADATGLMDSAAYTKYCEERAH